MFHAVKTTTISYWTAAGLPRSQVRRAFTVDSKHSRDEAFLPASRA